MRIRLLVACLAVVVVFGAACVALAVVPVAATVKLSNAKASSAKKPQSTGLRFSIDSCATPSAACPQPQSLTVTGEKGMKVNGANLKKAQLCKLATTSGKPDASTCKKKSQIGTGTAAAYVSGLGALSAPVTIYATTGTTKRSLAFAIYASVSGINITIPGTIAPGGGTIVVSIPQFGIGPIAGLNPILYQATLSLDKTKQVKVKGKKVKQHLFETPTVCTAGNWAFTVSEQFATDTGTAAIDEACSA